MLWKDQMAKIDKADLDLSHWLIDLHDEAEKIKSLIDKLARERHEITFSSSTKAQIIGPYKRW